MACHATYARLDGPAQAHRIHCDDAGRAIRRRCPYCGSSGVFSGFSKLRPYRPTCGHRFEREPGYWVGAVIFNTALASGSFPLTFGLVLLVTWPDVPWDWLAPIAVAVTALVPILLYSWSKTLETAYDLYVYPLEPEEVGAARERLNARAL